jgi:putative ABC transport system permease protein
MITILDQNGLGEYLALAKSWVGMFVVMFIGIMSIVIWNTGLMSGIRRYGEVGVRLAIGEPKGHVYGSLLVESLMIAFVGSVVGTAVGLGFSYLLQEIGLDISTVIQGGTMMMSNVMRARITPVAAVIGFVPGLVGTVFGTMMAGIGIFRRQTARLFKEVEA